MLLVGVVCPDFFPHKDRLNVVHTGENNFNASTHKNTSYKKLCEVVDMACDDGSQTITYIGPPMKIKLPFGCEEEFEWEVQYYPNDNEELTDTLGGMQFHAVLTCELISLTKPKNRRTGRIRVIGGVQPMNVDGGGGDGGGGDGGDGGGAAGG